MITTKSRSIEYLFNKDLAANIVFAEVQYFAAEANTNGPTEDEIQTLTRRLSWLVDRDLKWTDIDELVSRADELRLVDNGTHHMLDVNKTGTVDNTEHLRGALLLELFWEITEALGDLRPRFEVAA